MVEGIHGQCLKQARTQHGASGKRFGVKMLTGRSEKTLSADISSKVPAGNKFMG